jgi:hypothetical protein
MVAMFFERIEPTDPDETAGRALYRARADALAKSQAAIARRPIKMLQQLVTNDLPERAGRTHTGSLAAAVSVTRDNYHAVLDDVAQALNDEQEEQRGAV